MDQSSSSSSDEDVAVAVAAAVATATITPKPVPFFICKCIHNGLSPSAIITTQYAYRVSEQPFCYIVICYNCVHGCFRVPHSNTYACSICSAGYLTPMKRPNPDGGLCEVDLHFSKPQKDMLVFNEKHGLRNILKKQVFKYLLAVDPNPEAHENLEQAVERLDDLLPFSWNDLTRLYDNKIPISESPPPPLPEKPRRKYIMKRRRPRNLHGNDNSKEEIETIYSEEE